MGRTVVKLQRLGLRQLSGLALLEPFATHDQHGGEDPERLGTAVRSHQYPVILVVEDGDTERCAGDLGHGPTLHREPKNQGCWVEVPRYWNAKTSPSEARDTLPC